MKTIAHVPGSGGHFLCQVLTQLEHREPVHHYPRILNPARDNPWIASEQQWRRRHGVRYRCRHDLGAVWLRITVTQEQEWQWCSSNALWKDSTIDQEQARAGDPSLPSDLQISLRSLWQWSTFEPELARIQSRAATQAQHLLWRQWSQTWSPHTQDPRWQGIWQGRWGHHRPSYLG